MMQTERLVLRELAASDFADRFKMSCSIQDPGKDPPAERFERGLFQHYLDHQGLFGYSMYAVTLKSTGQFIGSCGLEHYEWDGSPEVEIAYDLNREFWGQGYATEAAAAVRDFAFGELGLQRIVSYIVPDNIASRRVVEKIGLSKEKQFMKDGRLHIVYALDRRGA
jgi:RimJ/RimL family protein N-acetyltransferase